MTVVISRSLRLSLGDAPALELAENFYNYKVASTASFGLWFGRDKAFTGHAGAKSRGLMHVHLEDAACVAAWDEIERDFYRKGYTQDNFTSDTMLVYGYEPVLPKSPYMLMSILAPYGHAAMNNNEVMTALCNQYDTELADYKQKMPCSEWIVVQ